jgi:hypothetical protein
MTVPQSGVISPKIFSNSADHTPFMTNPIRSTSASYANQVSQPAVRQPQPQTQASKSAGDVDYDDDSR